MIVVVRRSICSFATGGTCQLRRVAYSIASGGIRHYAHPLSFALPSSSTRRGTEAESGGGDAAATMRALNLKATILLFLFRGRGLIGVRAESESGAALQPLAKFG